MNHCQIGPGLDMLREDTVMVETFFKKNYFPWKISHRYKSRESDIVNSHVPLIQLQFSSVIQSRPLLCNPMDCSTLGFPVHHQLLELVQTHCPKNKKTHVHQVGDVIQPSWPLSSPSPAFNLPQHQGLFKWVSSSHQVAKVLELQLWHQSFQWIFRTDFL